MNWNKLNYFSKSEFKCNTDLIDFSLMQSIDWLRKDYGKPMHPSPVKGAIVRFGGSTKSRHYVGKDEEHIERKTTGIDIFPEGCPIHFYTSALISRSFNGIGVYLDTNGIDGEPWIMFHLDIRARGFTLDVPLIWIAEKIYNPETGELKTEYRYPQINPEYWKLLQDERLYEFKVRNTPTTG